MKLFSGFKLKLLVGKSNALTESKKSSKFKNVIAKNKSDFHSVQKLQKPGNFLNYGITKMNNMKNWFLSKPLAIKIVIILVFLGTGWFTFSKINSSRVEQIQYQTIVAEKGTFISSISASGTISAGNSTNITTRASGTVKEVYAKNGDIVEKGQKIAEIVLDDYAYERQSSSWVSYLNALEDIKTAEKEKMDADIEMWEARQNIINAEEDIEYKNLNKINPSTKKEYTLSEKTIIDKTLEQAQKVFDLAEMKYKNAEADIQYANAKIMSTWRDYQEVSSIITSPASGVVNNLALAPGVIIASSTSSNSNNTSNNTSTSTTVSSQKTGRINSADGQLQAVISLTEIDVTKVKPAQKATLILDAFPDKTFTGKVLAIDTGGSVSSGVTSYPVTVQLDPTMVNIYPNMAVSAQIITNVKTDIILIPTSAIQTSGNVSTVQIMKDGKLIEVEVETGDSNDTQTEIISGINERDTIVVSTVQSNSANRNQNNTNTSPFSGLGGRGISGSGGNNTRNVGDNTRFIFRAN